MPEFNNLTVKSLTDKLLSSFYSRGPRILNLRFVFLMKTQNPGSPTNKVTKKKRKQEIFTGKDLEGKIKRGKDRKHMKEKISHPAFLKEKEENHGWL